MLQYSEVLANSTYDFILTLRRLSLAEKPAHIKSPGDDVFTVWAFANKYARHSGVYP